MLLGHYAQQPSLGFESSDGLLIYSLSDLNACSHLSSHKNLLLSFNESKKRRHLSVTLEMNLLRAATLPVRLWTSFVLVGDRMSIRAYIFSRLPSIPLWLTMKLRNFLKATLNVHFSRFNFIRYFRRITKVSERCATWSVEVFELTSMSST